MIHSDVFNSRLGLVFGLLIGLGGLIAVAIMSLNGNAAVGGIIGFTTIASMIGAFIYGSRLRKEERIQRWQQRRASKREVSDEEN